MDKVKVEAFLILAFLLDRGVKDIHFDHVESALRYIESAKKEMPDEFAELTDSA